MANLKRSELESGAAEQRSARLLDPMRLYPGFICQATGPIADGYPMAGVWDTPEAFVRWLRGIDPRYWALNPPEEAL
ncbi:MAG TPA: hypothetical protein VF808_10875 [Ktedonobacterales bacterium]